MGERLEDRVLREWPPELEADLQYMHEGHDLLHNYVRDGMPYKDAAASLKELNTVMLAWPGYAKKHALTRETVDELTAMMTELGQQTLDNAINDWQRKYSFPYNVVSRGKTKQREDSYSFCELRYQINITHSRTVDDVKTQPVPKADPCEALQKIPVVKEESKHTLTDRLRPYLSPVAAACVFLSIPFYKILAKEPDNLDYVVHAMMMIPGASVIRAAYMKQKETCA